MPTSADKVLQYLEEAHALEAGLTTALSAHIAMTPRSPYRELLERHLDETRAQVERIDQRLVELGQSRSLAHVAYGVAQTVVGQGAALALAPLSLLRGTGGEEKLLKNAKDEVANESLEIATYDALEALAEAVDDPKTAVLAREHRTQEEVFLKELRAMIPGLVRDVVAAEVEGDPQFDPSTIGAADAARSARDRAAEAVSDAVTRTRYRVTRTADAAEAELSDAADAVTERVGTTADAAQAKATKAADQAAAKASSVADKAATRVGRAADEAEQAVDDAADDVKAAAAKAGDRAKAQSTKAARKTKSTADKTATKAKRTAAKADAEVKDAAATANAEVQDAAGRADAAVNGAAADADAAAQDAAATVEGTTPLADEFPIAGYDELSAAEVLKRLGALDTDQLAMVDGHERGRRNRKSVLDRVSALRTRKVEEQLARTA